MGASMIVLAVLSLALLFTESKKLIAHPRVLTVPSSATFGVSVDTDYQGQKGSFYDSNISAI